MPALTPFGINRLRLLREVSVRGSLAAAAEALGYDPSSVSHQLKALEAEVGSPLLERVGRGVRLTEAAQILVAHTEVVLSELEAAEAEIAAARHRAAGTVRIAAFQTAMHTIVPLAISRLAAAEPELTVVTSQVSAEAGLPALLARDFDLVVQEDFPSRPGRTADGAQIVQIGRDPLVLLTPAPLPTLPEAPVRTLAGCADQPWAMELEGTQAHHWALSECRRAGFEPRIAFSTSDVVLQVRLVALGLACALVPRLGLSAAAGVGAVTGTGEGQVVCNRLPGAPTRRLTTAIRRGSARTPSIIAVQNALQSAVDTLVEPTATALTNF